MESTRVYTSMPHFDAEPTVINGWNTKLENWLLEIQADTTSYYLMLTATARVLTVWKWVFLILYAVLTVGGMAVTIVTLNLSVSGVWLPILNICIALLGAFIWILVEALGFDEWVKDCRDSAGDFITLGRRIESQKRISRAERLDHGIKFSNAASMRFEELRADAPYIFDYMRKRYVLSQQVGAIQLPDALVAYHAQEPAAPETDHMFETTSMPTTSGTLHPFTPSTAQLQDLIRERVQAQREQDELSRYEDYVREQYAVASDSVLRKTAK